MKNLKAGMIIATLSIFIIACQKDDFQTDPISEDYYTEQDLLTQQYVVNIAEDNESIALETRDNQNPCVNITSIHPIGTFPNTLTIDFVEGCTDRHGHIVSGKIIVNQSAPMHEPGAIRHSYFENFMVDSIALDGQKTLTNLEFLENKAKFSRIANLDIIYPNGMKGQWESKHLLTQVGGLNTPYRLDDFFLISGETKGTNRQGKNFTSKITEPLLIAGNCAWISKGVRSLTTDDHSATINYGNGFCDPFATVELANGASKKIRIRDPWWK